MYKGFTEKDWVSKLPEGQKEIIRYSLGGPPTTIPTSMKITTKWMKDIALDYPKQNMGDFEHPPIEKFENDLRYCTVNYYSYLMQAMEIIGFKHPDEKVRDSALGYYAAMVEFLHLNPETEEDMDRRLEGRV